MSKHRMYNDALNALLTGPTQDDVDVIVKTVADNRYLGHLAELSAGVPELLREFGTNVLAPVLTAETGHEIAFGDAYPLEKNKGSTKTGWAVIAMDYFDVLGMNENGRQLNNIVAFFNLCIPNR